MSMILMVQVMAAKSRIEIECVMEMRQSHNDRPSRISLGINDSVSIKSHGDASGASGSKR